MAGLLSGGDATERRQRALVGAGVGGLAGGAIGNYQDRQERALRDSMAGTGVDVVRNGDNITLNMPENITFGFDRSDLQPQFYPVLDNVASTLREYNQTIVEVAGHTDSEGTDAYNQSLSERRASSVGNYLIVEGPDARPLHHGRCRRVASGGQQRHRGRPRAEPPRRDHAGADPLLIGILIGRSQDWTQLAGVGSRTSSVRTRKCGPRNRHYPQHCNPGTRQATASFFLVGDRRTTTGG